MTFFKKLILFTILLFISILARPQNNDFGLWANVGANKKLGKFNFNLNTELRTAQNSSAIDRLNLTFEGSFKLPYHLESGMGYEFIWFHDTEYSDFQPRHRGYIFIGGKLKTANFTFSLREKFQVTKKDDSGRIKESGKTDSYRLDPDWSWRNKFKIAYNIPHFPVNPSVSVESFYQLKDPEGNEFTKLRYTIELNYRVSEHHSFELFGLTDSELNVTNQLHEYVAGIGYFFSF